ncbi:MAG: HipA protein [Lachnospiraceae bacterium]|nr:HipA protein [Lachnospiraceae bacterium]
MEKYLMMNKDNVVANVVMDIKYGTEAFSITERQDAYLPYGFSSMNNWIEGRQAAKHRKHIKQLMKACGCDTKSGFISMTRCASLTDTFWVKKENDSLGWDDVSLYRNEFDQTIARIAFDGTGLYGQFFSTTTPELSTDGAFEKCWMREDDGRIYLYKRGSEGAANSGMEPYSEAFSSQLLTALGFPHVDYDVMKYHKKLTSKCRIFTSEDRGYVNFAAYTGKRTDVIEKIDIFKKLGLEDRFREMIIADALMLNTDRHEGNFGFLVDNSNGEIITAAPLFDHNLSMLQGAMEHDDIYEYIAMQTPRIGEDFASFAGNMMTTELRKKLIPLKDFRYKRPDDECPEWRIDQCNKILQYQLDKVLSLSRNKKKK